MVRFSSYTYLNQAVLIYSISSQSFLFIPLENIIFREHRKRPVTLNGLTRGTHPQESNKEPDFDFQ